MPLVLETPVKLRLPEVWSGSSVEAELRAELGYEDKGVTHEWRIWRQVQRDDDRRLEQTPYRPHWFVAKEGREALDAKVAALDAERAKTALFRDKAGRLYTYSGLAPRLAAKYGEGVERAYALPEPGNVPWEHRPDHEPRYYQTAAVDLMAGRAHAAVELATGLGKSLIIALICKRLGLPAVVTAPTLSIAGQLFADMTRLFGKRRVGAFFAGKKQANRFFTVAVSKSLTAVAPDSPEGRALAARPVLICDEAHLTPAETLQRVVLRLLAAAPYRFFLSGTQLRTDGLDLVLEGIVAEILLRKSVREGVGEGYLAKPCFTQYLTYSPSPAAQDGDPVKMNRVHHQRNERVLRHAGGLVRAALQAGRRPLVLVQEVSQFVDLLPFLGGAEVGFAHGGLDAKQKQAVAAPYHKSRPAELVGLFDAGALPGLVGTQCIGMGTDIKTANVVIDLVGLASETRLRQNVGRGTRIHGGKKLFHYVDYGVTNVPVLERQAEKRAKILDAVYGPVTVRHF